MKKLNLTTAENSSPHRGGTFDLGLEKTLDIFADYYGRNEKSAAGENFRNRDYFYIKNSAKMQKNGQQKTPPPGGGTENVFNLGIPPSQGARHNIFYLGGCNQYESTNLRCHIGLLHD